MSRRPSVVMAAVLLAVGGVAAQQKNPYRNYNEQKFVENMQSAARNYAAVNELIGRADYASAKAQLTRAREPMAVTIQFWRDVRQKDDAVGMLRKVLAGLDDLDGALSREPVDAASVRTTVGRVNEACDACHAVYREQDPATKAYRVKPAAVR